MYNMKHYTASLARERLSEALDYADRGEPVFIERKGVRYKLSLDTPKPKPKRARRASRIQIVDQAVAEGRWTWDWTATGARFRAPRKS